MFSLPAQRGDARRRVEQLGHAGRAARALVADDDHVVVGERVGRRPRARRSSARSLLKTRARPVNTPSVDAALDAGDLEDGAAVGREVAAQQAEAAGRLERRRRRVDDVAVGRRRVEPRDLLGQRLAGAREAVAVEQAGVEQLLHDDLEAALGVDVDHRVAAERPHVDEHRQRGARAR